MAGAGIAGCVSAHRRNAAPLHPARDPGEARFRPPDSSVIMPFGLAAAIITSAASRAPKRALTTDENLAQMARELRELKEEMRRRDERNRIRKILGL